MGKKQTIIENAFQDKYQVLLKLKENKVQSEKDLQKLSTATMLSIPGITIHDLKVIIELQQNVRDSRLFSYLLQDEGMKALAGADPEGGDDND